MHRIPDGPEAALLTAIEAHGAELRDLLTDIEIFCRKRDEAPQPEGCPPHSTVTAPLRWAAEGRTDLQKGLMCLKRAVMAPSTF